MTRALSNPTTSRGDADPPTAPAYSELSAQHRLVLANLLQRIGQQAAREALMAALPEAAGGPASTATDGTPGGAGRQPAEPVVLEAYLRVVAAAAGGSTTTLELAVPDHRGREIGERARLLGADEGDGSTARMLLRLGANGF